MRTSPKGIYSETLQDIIDAKLEELVKKREVFEKHKGEVIEACDAQSDKISYLRVLLTGVKHCFQIKENSAGHLVSSGPPRADLLLLLDHVEKFLKQPQYDVSVSSALLANWKTSLLQELEAQSARYEYASLYARLVTEWLSSEKGFGQAAEDGDLDMTDDYEKLESAAKLESRQEWEAAVFAPFKSSTEDVKDFLDALFGVNDAGKEKLYRALETLRTSVSSFETELLAARQFDEAVIKWCIDGLVARGRLDNNKLQVLKDFKNNATILSELADVLNLRLSNIEGWSWGDTVPVEQRRRLAGNYSNEMNEDLLQAIFLQYIGTKWAVFFRQKLANFIDTDDAWISAKQDIPTTDHQRRQYYLGAQSTNPSVQSERYRIWRTQYFLSQLPRTEWQKITWKDGAEEASHPVEKKRKSVGGKAPRKQLASKAARKSAPSTGGVRARFLRASSDDDDDDDDDDDSDDGSEPEDEDFGDDSGEDQDLMKLQQRLLHLLKTEVLINTRLYGSFSAFRGHFEKWDTMLPHATIMTVLSFVGVSKQWQTFFNSFLQAPLSFGEGENKQSIGTRQRGVPEHHPLSDALGEVPLFCLDLLVNQEAKGSKLWRIHDDFWFWSPDPAITGRVWSSINKYSQLFGIPLGTERAGSVQIGKSANAPTRPEYPLPETPIRWGFLYLDSKSGEYEIDQDMVDGHIKELKRQLQEKSAKGIIAWIQAWNAYANTFFSTNFGKPAVCFGPEHMEKILKTLNRMQKQVFENSNMVKHIIDIIAQLYGVADIPDGYVYFPTQAGGLDLRNPFIIPLLLEKALRDNDPKKLLDTWQQAEKEAYERAKKRFDKHVTQGNLPAHGLYHRRSEYTPPESDRHTFFSFEEYTRYREEYTYDQDSERHPLWSIYGSMLEEPQPESTGLTHDMNKAVSSSSVSVVVSPSKVDRDERSYWLWVAQVYGPEVMKKFGGLNIVDPGVLPIGMVGLLKGDRVEWS